MKQGDTILVVIPEDEFINHPSWVQESNGLLRRVIAVTGDIAVIRLPYGSIKTSIIEKYYPINVSCLVKQVICG